MGGSLSDKRLLAADFNILTNKLGAELRRVLPDVEWQMVPYYSKKIDFGDVDYVVRADAGDIIPIVEREFNPESMSVNDGIISFTYEGFQVDLICTKNNYETSVAYFSYNDVGNLLGRIFHKFGLKFGHEGLLYPLRDDRGSVREDIVVCTDMKKILDFIGCDHGKWVAGFDTMEGVFRFVVESKYFDRSIYDGELSAINKKRDKKRKTFNYFLTWLEIAQPDTKYEFKSRESRDEYVGEIESYFGVPISERKADLERRLETERQFRSKFNGELVMMLVPYKGNDLGKFIGMYKKAVLEIPMDATMSDDDNDRFVSRILEMEQDEITKGIMKLYDLMNSYPRP